MKILLLPLLIADVESDEMLPGEAMVEDISVSISSDEESSSEIVKKPSPRPVVNNLQTDITPNSIRLDALKLSKQLKCKIQSFSDDSVTNIELKVLITLLEYF